MNNSRFKIISVKLLSVHASLPFINGSNTHTTHRNSNLN